MDVKNIDIYIPYFNYSQDDIKKYIINKKLGKKSLNKKSNQGLFNILVNLILSKYTLNALYDKSYDFNSFQYRCYRDSIYHGMSIQYKNPYGVIINIYNSNRLCGCKKELVNYEYIHIVYNHPTSSYYCFSCLHKYITFSNQCIIELSKPIIIELFFILKQTNIFHDLVPDVFYFIFKTLLICNQYKK
jgi:hypothetical protein